MTGPVQELSEQLAAFFRQPELFLFAGAGVGKRVGLPDWHDYLAHLASVAATYEQETAALMQKRVKQGRLAEAAHLYKTCPLIPEGEKWQQLVLPFARDRYSADRLRDLVALPFKAIVTTNYDLSLADAAASRLRRTPRLLELNDPTLRQGQYLEDFYIARIHGRAEVPTSIIIDTEDFANLGTNGDYIDFLLHALRYQSCLFVGFSFEDPAIKRILDLFEQRTGPTFPRLHAAVIPADATALRGQLERYNIAVITYPAGQHDVVWAAFAEILSLLRARPVPPASLPGSRPFEAMRRFLACSYARLKLTPDIEPLRSLIEQGILLSVLSDAGGVSDRATLASGLRTVFAVTQDAAGVIAARAVGSLVDKGICVDDDRHVRLDRPIPNALQTQFEVLLLGVMNRLTVREGVRQPEQYREVVKQILDEILLERGWDAGAHFAAARPADDFDLFAVTQDAIGRHLPPEARNRRDQLARAVYQLVAHPDDREAEILIDLGRLTFGVDLAIERPNSTLVWETTLPHRIYLDANVLLPLIVPGHPATDAYVATLDKLRQAAESIGLDSRLFVAQQFLNEVLSHRRISRQLVSEYGLEEPRRLAEYVALGMGGENVFVVSYAARMRGQRSTYEEFLRDVAPYETDGALDRYLRNHGIHPVALKPVTEPERRVHAELRKRLHAAYAEDAESMRPLKLDLLIDHEALQLWELDFDARQGFRSLFVTADERFRRLLGGGVWARVGGLVVSPLNVIQLVDLVVGLRPKGRSLARVLWSMPALPEIHALREYFVDRGLEYYFGQAHAKGVPQLIQAVDELTRQAEEVGERERFSFRPASPGERKKALSVLDGFENLFYERMAREIKRGERGS